MSLDRRVVGLDMRSYGDSQWASEGNYTTEDFASDVDALVEYLYMDRVLGGSLWGRVALVFAAKHPERAAALVMEDVGAVRPPEISQRGTDPLAAGDPELDTVEEWADRFRGNNTLTPMEHFLHNAYHATSRLSNGKLALKRDHMILRDFVPKDLWPYLHEVQAPFPLLTGSLSNIVPLEQRDRLTRTIPDARAVTIEGAGHIIVHDRPDDFERAERGFLSDHGL
jgi:pimeloyl-ACP methyl ester carboxylesterase